MCPEGLLRVTKLSLGLLWAGGLVMTGLWLREHWDGQTTLWLCPFSAGLFVLMLMVADDLCPRASVLVTGFLKLAAALVILVSLFLALLPLGRWLIGYPR